MKKCWFVQLDGKNIRGPFLYLETAEVAMGFLQEIHFYVTEKFKIVNSEKEKNGDNQRTR